MGSSDQCIICQNTKIKEKTSSTENGRMKIKECANLKRDIVFTRLQLMPECKDTFVYHMTNDCYKKYVHHEKVGSSSSQSSSSVPTSDERKDAKDESPRSTRSHSTPRAPCSRAPDIYKTSCVICGCAYKSTYEKFRISEDNRAKLFLKATVFFHDDVYVRTCDLQDIAGVFGANLFCHKIVYEIIYINMTELLKKMSRLIQCQRFQKRSKCSILF